MRVAASHSPTRGTQANRPEGVRARHCATLADVRVELERGRHIVTSGAAPDAWLDCANFDLLVVARKRYVYLPVSGAFHTAHRIGSAVAAVEPPGQVGEWACR